MAWSGSYRMFQARDCACVGAYLSDCKVVEPSNLVQDREAAAKLWEVTKEQIAAKRDT